ncbi:hypothetical protein [Streptomyces sp. Isolate_45]|uniref:hypothetical protein n=1 Tax=Streptomyces sp. Isolate_45 TaxID=2950111 RepID=UPI002481A558|nr:hypothetical protein [Streptomyces sp. Isolate_45]MDA5284761.1 hypothetical protein [Streptomyces sp. Isolate_45]
MSARPTRSAAVALVILAGFTAGCSGATSDGQAAAGADPSAAAADRARAYMRAVVTNDWITACNLMSAPRRAACHDRHPTPEPPDPSGPAIGPVLLDRAPTRVPGTSSHPSGWGVITTHTITWPGKEPRTSYTAVRMTETAGTWWVEQRENVADSDLTHATDPAASALGREVR